MSKRLFLLGGARFDPTSVDGQGALLEARRTQRRIYCACKPKGPELYIASLADCFIVKRMPGQGHLHAMDCPSFAPPEELSGYANVHGEAIREDLETGETLLRLDFALSKSGRRAAPPEASDKAKGEVAADPRKLKLSAFLHYLWQEAELVKWVPGMAGKRNWSLVRHRILDAAAGKVAKSRDIEQTLFVPEVWRKDTNVEIAARRLARFDAFRATKGRAQSLGLLVGEYKSHAPSRFGSKLFIKHMPDAPFFMDEALARRFDDAFGDLLRLTDMINGARAMVIATFSVADAGYPSFVEIGIMLVNAQWLPFENPRDHALVEHLIASRRSFVKSQRFNLPPGSPIASAVLTDLQKPVALFVADPRADADAVSELYQTAASGLYPSWVWGNESEMPSLPTERTAS